MEPDTRSYFKKPRDFWDHPLWDSLTSQHKNIIDTMLREAAYLERQVSICGELVDLLPGELLRSREWIAKRAGADCTVKMVRTAQDKLIKHELAVQRPAIISAQNGAKHRAKGNNVIFAFNTDYFMIGHNGAAKVGAYQGAKVGQRSGKSIHKKGEEREESN